MAAPCLIGSLGTARGEGAVGKILAGRVGRAANFFDAITGFVAGIQSDEQVVAGIPCVVP